MHPRRLLGIIFTFSGLIFIPNMIQDIHKYITGELGLPIFDIAINLFLVPLHFFYFRKLSKPEKLTSRRIWPHLMPGISVLITSFFLSPLQEKVAGERRVLKRQLTFNYFPLRQPDPSSHHDHDIHASHSAFETRTHATTGRELFFHGRHRFTLAKPSHPSSCIFRICSSFRILFSSHLERLSIPH